MPNKRKILLPFALSAIVLAMCSCGNKTNPPNSESTPHEHTFSTDWESDDTYHWHPATCEHTDEVSDKEEHDYLPFGLCECGRYIGTDLLFEGTDTINVNLPDLDYGESVYYRINDFLGSLYLTIDHPLVSSFIYYPDSDEPVASPEQTSPTTYTYIFSSDAPTAYIVVTNYNGSTVSGAVLEAVYLNGLG